MPAKAGHGVMANRRPDTGLIQPYRPCPADFRDVFLRLGQSKEIEYHYRTNWRCIRRWIEEAGGDDLREERARLIGTWVRNEKYRSRAAKLYVQGKRLNLFRSKSWPCPAPTFWDMGLVRAEMARRELRRGPYKITIDRAVRLALAAVVEQSSEDFRAGVMAAVAAIESVREAA